MENIQQVWRNIKGFADASLAEWGMMALIALACIGAFALGRLSALEAGKPLISVTEAPQTASAASITLGGMVVASRSGETYYFPWCAGAAKIAPANQRLFVSADAAKKAGLRPAKNCKGLK